MFGAVKAPLTSVFFCHLAAFKVTAHLHAGNLAVEHVLAETHSGPVECMWHFIVLKCSVILMSHFLHKYT